MLVVEPVSVLFAPLQELFIKFLKRGNDWDRDKRIAAAVTDLVLYIAFFVAGNGAKYLILHLHKFIVIE